MRKVRYFSNEKKKICVNLEKKCETCGFVTYFQNESRWHQITNRRIDNFLHGVIENEKMAWAPSYLSVIFVQEKNSGKKYDRCWTNSDQIIILHARTVSSDLNWLCRWKSAVVLTLFFRPWKAQFNKNWLHSIDWSQCRRHPKCFMLARVFYENVTGRWSVLVPSVAQPFIAIVLKMQKKKKTETKIQN